MTDKKTAEGEEWDSVDILPKGLSTSVDLDTSSQNIGPLLTKPGCLANI